MHTTAQRQGWGSYFVHHNPAHVDVVKDSDAKESIKFVTLTLKSYIITVHSRLYTVLEVQ